MINSVAVSKRAEKELSKAPQQVRRKLALWIIAVEKIGLEESRKQPSYHDEPLKGKRAGERSIRLNIQWRAIYIIKSNNSIEFVSIEEVTPHDY